MAPKIINGPPIPVLPKSAGDGSLISRPAGILRNTTDYRGELKAMGADDGNIIGIDPVITPVQILNQGGQVYQNSIDFDMSTLAGAGAQDIYLPIIGTFNGQTSPVPSTVGRLTIMNVVFYVETDGATNAFLMRVYGTPVGCSNPIKFQEGYTLTVSTPYSIFFFNTIGRISYFNDLTNVQVTGSQTGKLFASGNGQINVPVWSNLYWDFYANPPGNGTYMKGKVIATYLGT